MDRQFHYHIRWSRKAALDWESFGTQEEAEAAAGQLMCPGETYTIEEHDETCQRCRDAMKVKSSQASKQTGA
jgi:hypothetical protein